MRVFLRASLFAFALLAVFTAASCGSNSTSTVASGAESGDDHSGDEHSEHGHGGGIEVPASMATPQVAINVTADAGGGQLLEVSLTDFVVAPTSASTDPVDGEGHLHLYVNGERQMRFYNTALHLDLAPGDQLVEVEVSANDHSAYLIEGDPIRAAQTISVGEPVESAGHAHGVDAAGTEADWSPAPSVSLSVTEDPKSGWNVHASTQDFAMTPAASGGDTVNGEGHMHLYVNGAKMARLYGEWFHIPTLPGGDVEVSVELNGNDHQPLTISGEPIAASVAVSVPVIDVSDPGNSNVANTVAISYLDGALTVEKERYVFTRGDTISIVLDADADELHVHGYDLHIPSTPGTPARLDFVATIPGLFEVELEEAGDFVVEFQVDS